jgi:SAM-dependent methyltransferase
MKNCKITSGKITAMMAVALMLALVSPLVAQHRDHQGPANLDAYIEHLLRPERVGYLQPDLVISRLDLPKSAVVADLGAGPGIFALPLGRHLEQGLVYAVDIEPRQLDALCARIDTAGIENVIPVLATAANPHLPPGRLDLVIIVDTYHHLENRIVYFRELRKTLRDGGRLVILEYKPGDLPVGPPAGHKIAPQVRESELKAAGYELAESFDTHTYHDFEIWIVN